MADISSQVYAMMLTSRVYSLLISLFAVLQWQHGNNTF